MERCLFCLAWLLPSLPCIDSGAIPYWRILNLQPTLVVLLVAGVLLEVLGRLRPNRCLPLTERCMIERRSQWRVSYLAMALVGFHLFARYTIRTLDCPSLGPKTETASEVQVLDATDISTTSGHQSRLILMGWMYSALQGHVSLRHQLHAPKRTKVA